MGRSKTDHRIVRGRQREIEALELRKAGLTYRLIGERLGITEQGAHAAVQRALRRLTERIIEEADEVRRLELERLDRLLLAVWPGAAKGEVTKVDRALRIMERRARLLGLDAPQRADVTSAGQPLRAILTWGDAEDADAGGDTTAAA